MLYSWAGAAKGKGELFSIHLQQTIPKLWRQRHHIIEIVFTDGETHTGPQHIWQTVIRTYSAWTEKIYIPYYSSAVQAMDQYILCMDPDDPI